MELKYKILLPIGIILTDIVLYLIIGFILLGYEDFYDESEGAYWSLASMTLIEKVAYISYYLLIIVNICLIIYLGYRIINKYILKNKIPAFAGMTK